MSSVSGELLKEELAKDGVENIDFKMVTFSLAGKDYGIDIMKVKEISKANKFTFVPNSSPFVRGVYNLRGDIISIIDLRVMFNLPAGKKGESEMEDMIILRLDEYQLGVIVDSIDKVVGIASETMQPPHPIFGDINIKFIRGVVDYEDRLYIILDVEKILGSKMEIAKPMKPAPAAEQADEIEPDDSSDVTRAFIKESLATFRGFMVSPLNTEWVDSRFEIWSEERRSEEKDLQLQDQTDADKYLKSFYSDYTGVFWGEDYHDDLLRILPDKDSGSFMVWNAGCGRGYESFSIAHLLKKKYSSLRIKIWAHDNDLLSISMAPNLVFQKSELPEVYDDAVKETGNGLQFDPEFKEMILFEYHDIINQNPLPALDLIVVRDVLSFKKPAEQERLLREFWEKLGKNGILVLGKNEHAYEQDWEMIREGNVVAFRKKSM